MFLRNLSKSFWENGSALLTPVRAENISFGSLLSKAFAAFSLDPAVFFFTGLFVTSAVGTDSNWFAGATVAVAGFAAGAGCGSIFLDCTVGAAAATLPFASLLLGAGLLGFPVVAISAPFFFAPFSLPFSGVAFSGVAFTEAVFVFGVFASAGAGFAAGALFPFAADGGGVVVADFPFPAGALVALAAAGAGWLFIFAAGLAASGFGFAAGFAAALGTATGAFAAGVFAEDFGVDRVFVFTSARAAGGADFFLAVVSFTAGFAADCVGIAGLLEAVLAPFVAVAAGSFGLLAAISSVPPK